MYLGKKVLTRAPILWKNSLQGHNIYCHTAVGPKVKKFPETLRCCREATLNYSQFFFST